ncbi:MAG: sulfurtransferase [Nostocoides sp.]
MDPVISVSDLADILHRPGVVVLDVQWNLVGEPGDQLYAAAHLAEAAHLDLDTALAGPPGVGGRHPLPDPLVLQDALRAAGVHDASHVIVYDQATSLAAARAWWVLSWAGLDAVQVLDGGLTAWEAAGLPVTSAPLTPPVGSVRVAPGALPALDAAGAATMAADGVLLDSRAAERFRGDSEPIDSAAGHIPGAVNAPMSDQITAAGSLRSGEELRRYFARLGVDGSTRVATSCGSGVTAAHTAWALASIGIDAAVYVGSWSNWIIDPSRPIATGA